MNTLTKLGLIAGIAATSLTATATTINGGISFTAIGWTAAAATDTGNLGTANAFTSFSGMLVTGATPLGDYVGAIGTSGITQNAFTFQPIPSTPVTPLWSFTTGGNTYSFDLLTVSVASQTGGTGDAQGLVLTGTGVAKITGALSREDTIGIWSLNASQTSSGGIVSFSFGTTATQSGQAVPDGGATAALLGLGVLGLGAVRRKLS